MAKANRAVVVEGYTDVLALHQAGMEGAVGVMGTAITPDQVATLSGTVDEVVLAIDADEAGEEAMLRAQRVAAGRRMRLRVASMPTGVDPAELMAEADGPERFRGFLQGAAELTDFQVTRVLDRTDTASPVERDRALAEVAPIIAGMEEGAAQSELIRKVADRLDLEPAMVMGRVVASTPATGGPGASAADPVRGPRRNAPPGRGGTTRLRPGRARRSAAAAGPAPGGTHLARTPGAGAAGDVHRAARAGRRVPREAGGEPPLAQRPGRRRLHPRPPQGPGRPPPARKRRPRRS